MMTFAELVADAERLAAAVGIDVAHLPVQIEAIDGLSNCDVGDVKVVVTSTSAALHLVEAL